MLDTSLWLKITKSSGIDSKPQQELFISSLNLFETVQYKIRRIKKSFSKDFHLSDSELEAYSRYITALTMQLMQNWEEIVKISLETICDQLQKFLSEDFQGLKKVVKSLRFCRKIEGECLEQGKIKFEYDKPELGKAIEKVSELKMSIIKKYF